MKKIGALSFAMLIIFALAACGSGKNEGNNVTEGETMNISDNEQENTTVEIDQGSSQNSEENDEDPDQSNDKLVVTLDSGEIIIAVYDNPTSNDFLKQLPLTLTFEEFGGFEKLSYPPKKLTTEGAFSGYTPERGDFSYFAPWGDVTMFYDDHKYSPGLIKMGEIISGIELLDNIADDFTVTFERMNTSN